MTPLIHVEVPKTPDEQTIMPKNEEPDRALRLNSAHDSMASLLSVMKVSIEQDRGRSRKRKAHEENAEGDSKNNGISVGGEAPRFGKIKFQEYCNGSTKCHYKTIQWSMECLSRDIKSHVQ